MRARYCKKNRAYTVTLTESELNRIENECVYIEDEIGGGITDTVWDLIHSCSDCHDREQDFQIPHLAQLPTQRSLSNEDITAMSNEDMIAIRQPRNSPEFS